MSCSNIKRKIFIHLHIPKCGGTSILKYLRNCFGSCLSITNNSTGTDFQYSSDHVQKILQSNAKLRCLSGHSLSLDLPFYDDNFNTTAITWIRNPIDRFISHYFYHRNHTNLVPQAKKLDMDNYITWALDEGQVQSYINGQCRFLSRDRDIDKIVQACKNKNLFLFPLDNTDTSFNILNTLWSDTFKKIKPQHINVSKKDQSVTQEQRERIQQHVKKDEKLLEIAHKNIQTLNTR